MTKDIDDILQSRASEDSFITFVGNNVDHNIATLMGNENSMECGNCSNN